MTGNSEPNVIDVLKNMTLACEENGLGDLPFVRDARRFISRSPVPLSTPVTQEALTPCPHCKSKPFVSENNVPGNWYGWIECDNTSCDVRPSISFTGPFCEAVSEAEEWNILAATAKAGEPSIVFDWKQITPRVWRVKVAPGWNAEVCQSMGDDTWSFKVNDSGRCNLASKEDAVEQAEAWTRARIASAVAEASKVFATFSLYPVGESDATEAVEEISASDLELFEYAISRLPEVWEEEGKALLAKVKGAKALKVEGK
ncbi:hypothetical protein O9X98_08810 [Agrobacterium salinitolerans]|nr:hypothetical protein [Agrobacterium salinitolerans]